MGEAGRGFFTVSPAWECISEVIFGV